MRRRIDYPALARVMLARGHTTGALAAELGLSQPSVSRLARGKTATISADVGVRLIELVGGHVYVPDGVTAAAVEPK